MPIPTMPSSQLIFFNYYMCVFVCECGFTPAVAHVHCHGTHLEVREQLFGIISFHFVEAGSLISAAHTGLQTSKQFSWLYFPCHQVPGLQMHIYLYPAFSQGSVSGDQAYIASTFTC